MQDKQVDYRKMYHIMMNAAEDAMKILIDAQRQCEELYIKAADTAMSADRTPEK